MSGVRFDSVKDLPEWAQKQLLGKMTGRDPSTPLRSAQDDRSGALRSQQDDKLRGVQRFYFATRYVRAGVRVHE